MPCFQEDVDWKQCFSIHTTLARRRWGFVPRGLQRICAPLPPGGLQSLAIELVISWHRCQICDGSLTSNELLLAYVMECRASQSVTAIGSSAPAVVGGWVGAMRGRYLSKERGIFVVGDKQGCLSGRVALRIERQLLIICKDCLMHGALSGPFMWKWGVWSAAKTYPLHPTPPPHPLAPPINASITPQSHVEVCALRRRRRSAEVTSLLNVGAQLRPNAISP